jgi:hypothetical protein
MQGGD